jgi:hypothetical protein
MIDQELIQRAVELATAAIPDSDGENVFEPWPDYYAMPLPDAPRDCNDLIEEVQRHILECREALRVLNIAMADQERAYRRRARTEKADGSDKLKCTNDQQRADFVDDLLEADVHYQVYMNCHVSLTELKAHLEIQQGVLERHWKLLRYDYELSTVGKRPQQP